MTTKDNTPTLGVIIPCYNEKDVLQLTIEALCRFFEEWQAKKLIAKDSFVLFVDDGSSDDTWEQIERVHAQDSRFRGLKLAHNVGHQNALFAGLVEGHTVADCVVSMDADLQDDVSVIEQFLARFAEGNDIVYGVREDRQSDSWFKRTTAQGFYRFIDWLGVETVYNHADYRLMSKRAVETLCAHPERNLFLRGIVPSLGFQATEVTYTRHERQAGESKYPLRKMIALAWDGVTSFSVRPIKLLFLLSLFMLIVSVGFVGYALYQRYEGETMDGWTSLMMSIWFIGGLQLFGIGLIGEYIGKIYQEVKRRPRYVVEKIRE
ncbi:glycosyltransferase family 2 protein (plasmid) [Exiguobacterium sp. Helios]|uniref:glycosyltransferase family 2 protein n=1 Tax=Exiguobacterium sp. Helios TaxID=2735868 RepID=UPI00165E32AA|nr:glycosyltransferase family 2 protein [Exiguobacterium sp. Helios]QNR22540.1 glycosyltransferase family 2 protein [Exiguobacterium sp. Helios]